MMVHTQIHASRSGRKRRILTWWEATLTTLQRQKIVRPCAAVTQVVLEWTGILLQQMVKSVGCLDLGLEREEKAWLQESRTMIFIEIQIAQVFYSVNKRKPCCRCYFT